MLLFKRTIILTIIIILIETKSGLASLKINLEEEKVRINENHYVTDYGKQNRKLEFNVGKDIFSSSQFNNLYFYFFKSTNELNGKLTINEYIRLMIEAKFHSYAYNDHALHRYDNLNELKLSGGLEANQEKCLFDLMRLIQRVDKLNNVDQYNSNDLNIYQLMDTFGRTPSDSLRGNTFWLGSYDECLRSNIIFSYNNSFDQVGTRYCIASVKLNQWLDRNGPLDELNALKIGVCLPKSCDSQDYKNKFDLISKLLTFNARQIDIINNSKLVNLYCLPDENAPFRDWKNSTGSIFAASLISIWFAFLILCTIKSYYFSSEKEENILDSLSLINNLKLLFKTTSKKQETSNNDNDNKFKSIDIEAIEFEQLNNRPIVDLSVIEGIKVISMMYIITGHVLMSISIIIENGRDGGNLITIPYITANMTPAFAVNSFFVTTGLLTSYFCLKYNTKLSCKSYTQFIFKPTSWFWIIIQRYLRIMPTYLCILIYIKLLAKYNGSGPLWDYATSSISQRKICEQESWWINVLLLTNFKSPFDTCIPSSWYLSNDFQFLLITPFLLIILYLYKERAKFFINLLITISYIANFINIYYHSLNDIRPISNYMPYGFKTYITFFHSNYVQFQYRILAYLIGINLGYRLFNYENIKLFAFKMNKVYILDKYNTLKDLKDDDDDYLIRKERKNQSKSLFSCCERLNTKLTIIFLIWMLITPYVASKLSFTIWSAKLSTALGLPLCHLLFSYLIGTYILLAATNHGNKTIVKLLSSPYWKPLSRLSLCIILTNIEVINYFLQTRIKLYYIDGIFHFNLNIILIVLSYLVALVAYILFEAPLRIIINQLMKKLLTSFSLYSDERKLLSLSVMRKKSK